MSSYLIRRLTLRDSTLSPASLQALTQGLSAPVSIPAGTVIVEQGSRPGLCTLVVSGWAARLSALPDGRRSTVALHISGDFVDLHSYPIKVMDHSVISLSACAVATIDHPTIRRITETDAHLTRVLWLQTLVDASIHRQWLLSAARRSALEHTAHLICELFTRLRVVSLATPGKPFQLPLSQQQLADALGISSEHLNRMLAELRSRRLFEWRGVEAQVLDLEALQALAQFDATYLVMQDEPR